VIPSIVLGAIGGAIVLAARLRRRESEDAPVRPAAIAWPSAPVWGVLLLAVATFAPTLAWLYAEFTTSIWRNPHGLFVPFFAILLARHRLRERVDPDPSASAWGFAWLIPACALVVLDAGIRSHYIGLLGLLLALPGLSLLLLGAERTRRIAFPLALCVFLVPLPDGLRDPAHMPSLSAAIGAGLAQGVGVAVVRTGAQLEIAGGRIIEVSQNCSGLSFFYGGLALAVLCTGVARSWPRRLILVAAPYVLAVLANGLRVGALLVIARQIGLDWKYDTPIHGAIGTAAFYAVIGGVWLLSDRRALRESLA
jgi:exosortase